MLDGVGCISKGESETFDFWQLFNDRRRQNNPSPACVPNGITGREIAEVVVRFISEHPAEKHHAMSDVALAALLNAFPCRNRSH